MSKISELKVQKLSDREMCSDFVALETSEGVYQCYTANDATKAVLTELIKETPNDIELGKLIREKYGV